MASQMCRNRLEFWNWSRGCVEYIIRLICITDRPPMAVITSFNQIQKTSFGPLGKWGVVWSNSYEIRPTGKSGCFELLVFWTMKHIIYFNYISFIHKSSIVYTSIRFHQDCKSLQQGIGEMALFLQYWTIIHEISWIFDLRYF